MSDSNITGTGRHEQHVRISTSETPLDARLVARDRSAGLVIFADGRGHGTTSATDLALAASLEQSGLATLIVDLLTHGERAMDERTGRHRGDVSLLTRRLLETTEWVLSEPQLRMLNIGYLGTGAGAGAAVAAAAGWYTSVRAVAGISARLDRVARSLARVQVPLLLLVGADDPGSLHANRACLSGTRVECDLLVIPNATRELGSPESMRVATRVVREFFSEHLVEASGASRPVT